MVAFKVVPYTSGKIWSARLIFLFFCSVFEYIYCNKYNKILTNSNQQTHSYKFTSHIAAFLSVVLITEMLEICIQTSYDQNVQLMLRNYLPVVYGTPLNDQSLIVSSALCSSFYWFCCRLCGFIAIYFYRRQKIKRYVYIISICFYIFVYFHDIADRRGVLNITIYVTRKVWR